MPQWEEITASERFKALTEPDKRKVTGRFLTEKIEGPRYRSLRPEQQSSVRSRLYSMAGLLEHEIGPGENFLNAASNSLLDSRFASWYQLFGSFESSDEVYKNKSPVNPGSWSEFLGSVAGDTLPWMAAVGASVVYPPAAIAIPILAAEVGARKAGNARKIVRDYEVDTGEEISAAGEIALMAGMGTSAILVELAGGKALTSVARGGTGRFWRMLVNLKMGPDKSTKALGDALVSQNYKEMSRIVGSAVARSAGIEAQQEGFEQFLDNVMIRFVDSRVGIMDGVWDSVLGGAIAGAGIGTTAVGARSGMHYLAPEDVAELKKKREEVAADVERGAADIPEEVVEEIAREDAKMEAGEEAAGDKSDPPPLEPPTPVSIAMEATVTALLGWKNLQETGKDPSEFEATYRASKNELIKAWLEENPEDNTGESFNKFFQESDMAKLERKLSSPEEATEELNELEKEIVDEPTQSVATDTSPASVRISEEALKGPIERVSLEGEDLPGTFDGKEIVYSGKINKAMTERFLTGMRYALNALPTMSEHIKRVYLIRDWGVNSAVRALQDMGLDADEKLVKAVLSKVKSSTGLYIKGTDGILVKMGPDRKADKYAGTVAHELDHAFREANSIPITESAAKETERQIGRAFRNLAAEEILESVGMQSETTEEESGKGVTAIRYGDPADWDLAGGTRKGVRNRERFYKLLAKVNPDYRRYIAEGYNEQFLKGVVTASTKSVSVDEHVEVEFIGAVPSKHKTKALRAARAVAYATRRIAGIKHALSDVSKELRINRRFEHFSYPAGIRKIYVVSPHSWNKMAISSANPDHDNTIRFPDDALGLYYHGADYVYVKADPYFNGEDYVAIISHEMKHSFDYSMSKAGFGRIFWPASDKIIEQRAESAAEDVLGYMNAMYSPEILDTLGMQAAFTETDAGTIHVIEESDRGWAGASVTEVGPKRMEPLGIAGGEYAQMSLRTGAHLGLAQAFPYVAKTLRDGEKKAFRDMPIDDDTEIVPIYGGPEGQTVIRFVGDVPLIHKKRAVAAARAVAFAANSIAGAKVDRAGPNVLNTPVYGETLVFPAGIKTIYVVAPDSWNYIDTSKINPTLKQWGRFHEYALGMYYAGQDFIYAKADDRFSSEHYIGLIAHEVKHSFDWEMADIGYGREFYPEETSLREARARWAAEDILGFVTAMKNPYIFFQPKRLEDPVDPVQKIRLLAPFKRNGIFQDVIQQSQVFNEDTGEAVNASINVATGTLLISSEIDLSTIGHEATHRMIHHLGTEHATVKALLAEFGGDVEAMSDAVGRFYANRELEQGLTKRVGNLISDLFASVKQWLGVEKTREDLLSIFNKELVGRSKEETTQEADIPPPPPRKEKGATIDPTKSSWLDNLPEDMENLVEWSRHIDQENKKKYRPTDYEFRGITADREKVLSRGIPYMEQLIQQFGETGRANLAERDAMRVYNERLALRYAHLALNEETENSDEAQTLSDKLVALRKVNLQIRGEAGTELSMRRFYGGITRVAEALVFAQRDMSPQELAWLRELIEKGKFHEEATFKAILKYLEKPSIQDIFGTIFINNILSNPGTHAKNLFSNTFNLAWNLMISNPLEAVIGKTIPFVDKESPWNTPLTPGEIVPTWIGALQSITGGAAWQEAKGAFSANPLEVMAHAAGSKLEQDMVAVIGTLSRIPQLQFLAPYGEAPSRFLIAADIFFKSVAMRSRLAGIAHRRGLRGTKVDEYISNPDDAGLDESLDFARYVTFTSKTGEIIRHVRGVRDAIPFVGLANLPFLGTVTNIIKRGFEMIPGVGLLALVPKREQVEDEDVEGGQRGRFVPRNTLPRIAAKQIEGLAIAYLLSTLIEDWEITDEAPIDPRERDLFYAQGKLPYSIKMNAFGSSYWVSYRGIEPFATLLSAISAFNRKMREVREKDDKTKRLDQQDGQQEADDMFVQIGTGIASMLMNSTWTENLGKIFEREIRPYAVWSFAGRTASNLIPMSGLLRSVHKGINTDADGDYRYREYLPGISEIANTLPWTPELTAKFFGEDMHPRITALGEVAAGPGGFLNQWLPVKWQDAVAPDSVEAELERIGFAPQRPRNTIDLPRYGKVIMEDEDFFEYTLAYGIATKKALSRLIKRPGYERATDARKLKLIDRALDRARSPVTARMKARLSRTIRAQQPIR